jgi:hypothetical protein
MARGVAKIPQGKDFRACSANALGARAHVI